MRQAQAFTILLVETDPSLRRLISLGLQHRGLQVLEVNTPEMLSELVDKRIDLLVLDVDGGAHRLSSLLEALESCPALLAAPTVQLVWDDQIIVDRTFPATDPLSACTVSLTKPFDARILHQTIDQMLAAKVLAEARMEAEQEAILLASHDQQAPASIWPLVTAAGLLIAITGVLLQYMVAVVGFVIVVVALLLWTLGSGQAQHTVALS